jgi:hypothetical protein
MAVARRWERADFIIIGDIKGVSNDAALLKVSCLLWNILSTDRTQKSIFACGRCRFFD